MQFTIDKNLTIKGTRGDYGTIHITFDRDMTGTSGKFIVKKNAATRDEDAFLVKSFVFGLNPAITGKELVLSLTPHDTAEMPIERPESPYTFESDFENIEFVDYIWTIKLINGQEEEIIIPRSGCPNPTFRLYNEAYIGRPGRPIIPGCPPRWDMFVTKHDFLNYAAGERQITDRLSGRITALDSRLSQTEASLHVDMTNLSKDVDSKLATTKAELNEKLSKSENRLEDKIDAKNTETRFELGNRIDANQKLIVNHDTKIASLDSRVTVLEQKDRNIDALKAQVETNTKNILKNAQGIDEAKTDVAALNTRVTATELEMNQVLSAVAGYSQRIGTCETKVAACEAKVGSMDARMTNCENVVSELGTTMRDTLSSFSSRINGAETKANEAKILSENATTKVNSLESVLNNTNGRVTSLETNTGIISSSVGSLKGRVGNLDSDLEATKTRVTGVETSSGVLSTTVAGVMARMTVAEGQVTNLNASVVALSGNVITNNAKVDALTTRVGTAEGGITSLGTQIAALDTEVHTCQEKVIAVENFVVQTRAELTGAVDGINRRLTGRMDGIDAKMDKVVGEVLSSDATTKVTVLRDTAMYVENIWNPGRTPHTCDERVIGTDILNINDVIQTLNDYSVSLSGAAASADVELQNQISLLSSAASTADEALATAISTLSSNASTADAALATAISTLSGNASTADAELATAIANEATAREGAVTSLSSNVVTALALKVNTADTIIPGMATSADTGKWSSAWAIREFVNSSIETHSAVFRGSFATKAEMDAVAWQTTDPAAANYVTNNDYAYVREDETQSGKTCRYKYKNQEGASDNGWKFEYNVNDTAFTVAQLNALNSGITASDWTSAKSTISTTSSNLATVSSNLGTVSSNLATLSGSAVTTSANLGTVSSNLSTLSGSVGTISGNVGTISGNVTGLKTNLGKVQLGGTAASAISKLNPLIGVNLLKKSGDKVAIDTNVAYDDENVVNFLVAVVNTLIGQVS